jgi:MFS family permease
VSQHADRAATPASAVARLGLAVFAIGVATTLPMPLFTRYAERDGQGAGMLALAFVCYALTLIATAPLLGGLSERIGRRPCLLAGVALAGCATLALVVAPGLWALAVARTLQGLAVGVVAGAATAWAAELAGGPEGGRRAAAVMAAGTAGGFGAGGLLTLAALAVQDGAEPPASYLLHLLACAVLLAVVARLPETHRGRPGPWLRSPSFPRGTLPTSLAMIPAWGTTGVTLTSVPAALAAQGLPRTGPLAVCFMILVGVALQQGLRRVAPRRAVLAGLGCLVAGTALVVWGTLHATLAPLLAGGALVGCAAYGLVYLGGLAAVSEAAGADRANAAAGFFLVAHVGFSVPPLLTGLAVDRFGAPAALWGLWAAVAAMGAGLALAIIPAGTSPDLQPPKAAEAANAARGECREAKPRRRAGV